jgi:hypothetical protein
MNPVNAIGSYYAAGYAPVPLMNGQPWASGLFTSNPSWRASAEMDPRFADIALLCSAKPLSGATGSATLDACARSWVAGIRWESTERRLSAEIAAAVELIAGPGPTRFDGSETLKVFRVETPFASRSLSPVYLPKEKQTSLKYRPHRFSIASESSFFRVSGGRWAGGSVPEVPRNELPTLTRAHVDEIMRGIEALYSLRGALPWL